ncbi:MAG TPA: hypothetical protein VD866_07400 [Urbifossiella sp.]|nr:hypothetical protein [Urbifossiella sp.]
MTRLAPAALALAVAAAAAAQPPAAANTFDRYLPYIPPDANVLVLVDVKAAYDSPIGKKEKWAEGYKDRYQSGVGFVAPYSSAVVIGANVNLNSMTRDHQVGVVGVPQQLPVRELAERNGGTPTEIAGRPFALSPRDVYFTTLSTPATVALYPADRQAAARWSRHAAGAQKEAKLSPYLTAAAAGAGGKAVTVAVDLAESQDPALLRVGLAASPTVVNAKLTPEGVGSLAGLIGSAKGLTFTAAVGEAITGTVRIDFAAPFLVHQPVLKPLFLELLDQFGVAVPGLSSWEAKFEQKAMSLSGPLAPADLRRVLSLFAFPGTASEDDGGIKPGELSPGATQRYFAATNTILSDLRKQKESKDYNKMATWHDKAADQLYHLNRTGVDPLALKVADDAGRRLKALGLSLRGVPIDTKALDASSYYTYSTSGGGWGWWGGRSTSYSTNIPQVRGEIAQVVARDEKTRLTTWAQIDTMVSDTRRQLGEKYKLQF